MHTRLAAGEAIVLLCNSAGLAQVREIVGDSGIAHFLMHPFYSVIKCQLHGYFNAMPAAFCALYDVRIRAAAAAAEAIALLYDSIGLSKRATQGSQVEPPRRRPVNDPITPNHVSSNLLTMLSCYGPMSASVHLVLASLAFGAS